MMRRFSQSGRIAARVIEGTAFVVAIDQQALIELNEVGTFVWESLRAPMSHEALTEAVVAHFEVDEETALRDVSTFLDVLVSRGVVVAEETGA